MAGIDAARFRKPLREQIAPYADPAYWDARYQDPRYKEPYEWYLCWEHLQPLLMPILVPPDPVPEGADEGSPPEAEDGGAQVQQSQPADGEEVAKSKDAEILVLGCGTSSLSQDLYADGFSNITNVDRSEFVVQAMRERHQEQISVLAGGGGKAKAKAAPKAAAASPEPDAQARKQMRFEVIDAQSLPKEWAGRFDVVIDKAVLDSITCGAQRWKGAEGLLKSVSSVLKPGTGVYFCVSFAGPDARQKMLIGPHQEAPSDTSEAYGWVFSSQTVGRPLVPAFVDPKAKDKAELKEGPAYDAEKDVYHVYTCRLAEG